MKLIDRMRQAYADSGIDPVQVRVVPDVYLFNGIDWRGKIEGETDLFCLDLNKPILLLPAFNGEYR